MSNLAKSVLPLTLLAFLALPQAGSAQDAPVHHKGFYFSGDLGIGSGTMTWDATNGPFSHASLSGTSPNLDLRVGGAVSPDLILSFDVCSWGLTSSKTLFNNVSNSGSKNWDLSTGVAGLGLTHYFRPSNCFVGLTVGMGSFSYSQQTGAAGESNGGFGCQVRAGREWWVSKNWGLGVTGGIMRVSANDKAAPGWPNYSGSLASTNAFVAFSGTFN
jgi:hypothetical protein